MDFEYSHTMLDELNIDRKKQFAEWGKLRSDIVESDYKIKKRRSKGSQIHSKKCKAYKRNDNVS